MDEPASFFTIILETLSHSRVRWQTPPHLVPMQLLPSRKGNRSWRLTVTKADTTQQDSESHCPLDEHNLAPSIVLLLEAAASINIQNPAKIGITSEDSNH